jgi:hypothetical protein
MIGNRALLSQTLTFVRRTAGREGVSKKLASDSEGMRLADT